MVKSHQMISFPSSIKVGSQDIYVRLVPGLSDLSDDEGSYDGRKQLISFDKDIIDKCDPYALLLVWHELDHVIFEQHLYLRQPGYGSSYITGKYLLEQTLADFAKMKENQEKKFVLSDFFDELNAIGSIPVSLTRWEMTGLRPTINIFESDSK